MSKTRHTAPPPPPAQINFVEIATSPASDDKLPVQLLTETAQHQIPECPHVPEKTRLRWHQVKPPTHQAQLPKVGSIILCPTR